MVDSRKASHLWRGDFSDVDDLASRNQILSHELEHLIHFQRTNLNISGSTRSR